MVDLLYVLAIIAFFALMVLFVKWCERIIGRDDAVDLPHDVEDDDPCIRRRPVSFTRRFPHEELRQPGRTDLVRRSSPAT